MALHIIFFLVIIMNVNTINYNDNIIGFACNRLHHFMRRLCESLLNFFSSQHPPLKKEVLKYMSEVMISRRGGGKSEQEILQNARFITEIITTNTDWTVPSNLIGNSIDVRIIGGGGTGGTSFSSDYFCNRGNEFFRNVPDSVCAQTRESADECDEREGNQESGSERIIKITARDGE